MFFPGKVDLVLQVQIPVAPILFRHFEFHAVWPSGSRDCRILGLGGCVDTLVKVAIQPFLFKPRTLITAKG